MLPDELLLQLFALIDAEDLIAISVTSKRLREIALDHTLWCPFCERILKICSETSENGGNDVDKLNLSTWGVESYFELYLGLRRWEPYLGWWISADTSASETLRFSLDAQSARVVKSRFQYVQEFDERSPLVPGSRILRFHWGVHIAVEPMDGDSVTISVQDINYVTTSRMSFDWHATTRGIAGRLLPPSADYWESWSVYTPKVLSRVNTIFPSPSVYTALRGAGISSTGDLICRAYYDEPLQRIGVSRAFIPIHTPDSAHWERNPRNPVDSGLYVASYGAHGQELVSVSFRVLTQRDFEWNNDGRRETPGLWWPWDFHLSGSDPLRHYGPFAGGTGDVQQKRCGEITPSDLRPGLRIMEVTKLTGDSNVPRGQRSVIAFLDIPNPAVTSSDMSRANRAISEANNAPVPSYAVLPQHSKRPAVAPWPMLLHGGEPAAPARIMTPREMMSPGAGWVVHGIGHISEPGFIRPGWCPSYIHFASRQEFQVFWLGMVMTYTRLR